MIVFEKRESKGDSKYWQFPTVQDYLGVDIDLEDQEEVDNAIKNRGYGPDLVAARRKFFADMTADMIADIEVVDVYTDDHEPCVDVHMAFTTGDVLSVAVMYTSLVGAFQYWDSPRAQSDIVEYFNYYGDPENDY